MFLNKIGLSVESNYWRPSLALFCSNTDRTVWGAARTRGAVGSGARRQSGGVSQTCASAPHREEKYTRLCQFPLFVYYLYRILTMSSLDYAVELRVAHHKRAPRVVASHLHIYTSDLY